MILQIWKEKFKPFHKLSYNSHVAGPARHWLLIYVFYCILCIISLFLA